MSNTKVNKELYLKLLEEGMDPVEALDKAAIGGTTKDFGPRMTVAVSAVKYFGSEEAEAILETVASSLTHENVAPRCEIRDKGINQKTGKWNGDYTEWVFTTLDMGEELTAEDIRNAVAEFNECQRIRKENKKNKE